GAQHAGGDVIGDQTALRWPKNRNSCGIFGGLLWWRPRAKQDETGDVRFVSSRSLAHAGTSVQWQWRVATARLFKTKRFLSFEGLKCENLSFW
ncbi:hypothetical protein PanWU01x14_189900, partial [Parasponia andersonii]